MPNGKSGTLRQMGSEQPSMPTSSRLVNVKQGRPMPTGHPYRSTQDAAVSFLVPDRAPRSPSPSRRKHQPDRSQYAATSLGIARAGPRRIDDARAQRRYCLSRPEWSWTGPRGALPSRGAISMGSGRARVPIAIMPGRWSRRSAGRCRHGLLRAGRVGLSSRGLADLLAIQGRRSS